MDPTIVLSKRNIETVIQSPHLESLQPQRVHVFSHVPRPMKITNMLVGEVVELRGWNAPRANVRAYWPLIRNNHLEDPMVITTTTITTRVSIWPAHSPSKAEGKMKSNQMDFASHETSRHSRVHYWLNSKAKKKRKNIHSAWINKANLAGFFQALPALTFSGGAFWIHDLTIHAETQ